MIDNKISESYTYSIYEVGGASDEVSVLQQREYKSN